HLGRGAQSRGPPARDPACRYRRRGHRVSALDRETGRPRPGSLLTLHLGVGAVVALVQLLMPDAAFVFPADRRLVAGDALLAGGAAGGRLGGVVAAIGLGIDAVDPVGPAAVVLDELVDDLDHR